MFAAYDLVVEKQTVGNVGLVKADGIMDLNTMRPMREAVRTLLSEGAKHLVLDVRDVDFMDSAGMSIIMTAKRGVSDQRGLVYLITKPSATEEKMRTIEINRIVNLASTTEEALTALAIAVV